MIKYFTQERTFKSLFLLMAGLLFSVTYSYAQTVEITPSYGYQFGSKLNYGFNNFIKIKDSDQWGVTLGFETFDNTMAEVSYTHHSTSVTVRDSYFDIPDETRLADLAADWVMIGGTRYFPKENIRPFAGAAVGLVFLSPKNENREITDRTYSNETRFSFSFKAGVNIMFSDHVGINLQGNLLFPVNWGGFYVGGGPGGINGGVSVASTTVIGGFSGGLVFRI
ncbi:outer membrane beta-barrel protein [Tamlana fucoidanivorans]|uniref:Porin family protein n=1 Tax=Allotamlana fucoidanivorans TaxID=2583814 RepID=A0A5C4SHL9_9FLAO|nr:outer membrane beta-barrel protein [Tamlana fucoidanivorans]TNJ42517.1 porin family protein [Tamlana fucoidanivorans]